MNSFSSIVARLDAAPRAAARRSATWLIPGRWMALGMIGSLIVLVVMMAATNLSIDPFRLDETPFYIAALFAIGLRVSLRDPRNHLQRWLRDCAEYFGLITLVTLTGALASYPCAAMTHGYVDAGLQRIDTMLHFDWLAWYETVVAHPSLRILGRAAYDSIYVTPAVFLAYLAWTDRKAEARAFIATFWLAAIIALLLFHYLPAVGPFAYLWHAPIPYMPESALWQPELFPLLRAHTLGHVDVGQLRGLVSAPSFHTTMAALYIVGAWRYPVLRWPVTAVNVAMLLSTPVEGTHYLADMIAGALVACVALTVAAEVNARMLAGVGRTRA